jgi:hypothetical protein
MSRLALGPTQPPIQWLPASLCPRVKQTGHKAEHSPPSCASVKKEWSCTSTPSHIFMAWCLISTRGNFLPLTFFFLSDKGIPYGRVYKQHFMTRIYPPKLGCGLCTEYYVLLTTELATPVLYVVKLPVETASV